MYTTLRIRKSTKEKLNQFGHAGETHDQIINKIMKMAKSQEEK